MSILIMAVLAVLLASALCSGAEAALFSVPIVKVKSLIQDKRKGSKALASIRENMGRPIAAIVVLNNIANIVGSIVVGGLAAEVLGSHWIGVFSGVLTFLVIIFSEIIPKTLGEKYSETIALLVAPPVLFIAKILSPILWLIEKLTSPITGGEQVKFTTNEAEIKLLASIGEKEGVIEKKESSIIQKAFEMNNTTASMMMTPRVKMTYLDGNKSLEDVKDEIIQSEHSRILIVDVNPDKVLGVAMKDTLLTGFLTHQEAKALKTFAKPVKVVRETDTADKLLINFQKTHRHLCIVSDEFGGVAGVVTLEDVVEILTGEIIDETDREVDLQASSREYKKGKDEVF